MKVTCFGKPPHKLTISSLYTLNTTSYELQVTSYEYSWEPRQHIYETALHFTELMTKTTSRSLGYENILVGLRIALVLF